MNTPNQNLLNIAINRYSEIVKKFNEECKRSIIKRINMLNYLFINVPPKRFSTNEEKLFFFKEFIKLCDDLIKEPKINKNKKLNIEKTKIEFQKVINNYKRDISHETIENMPSVPNHNFISSCRKQSNLIL